MTRGQTLCFPSMTSRAGPQSVISNAPIGTEAFMGSTVPWQYFEKVLLFQATD